MADKRLTELLEFVETTDLQEVILEKKGVHISFTRTVTPKVEPIAAASADAASMQDAAPAKAPEPMTIKSTMVGTFYRSDSPNRPPLVVEGTKVASGQPVAAIEAMKIMKDVLSPGACRIVKALVANGHPVEYGQPLFVVEPESEESDN